MPFLHYLAVLRGTELPGIGMCVGQEGAGGEGKDSARSLSFLSSPVCARRKGGGGISVRGLGSVTRECNGHSLLIAAASNPHSGGIPGPSRKCNCCDPGTSATGIYPQPSNRSLGKNACLDYISL